MLELSGPGAAPDPQRFGPYAEFGVLPATGTWTLTATNQQSSPQTGTVTVDLVVPEVTAALTLGTPTTRTFSPAGQTTNLTFNATAGQKLRLRYTAVDLVSRSWQRTLLGVQLVRPDGTPDSLGSAQVSAPGLATYDLAATGTWTIRIDPYGDTTGTATLVADMVIDQVVRPALGKPVSVSLPGDGTGARFTVSAKAGQRLTFGVTASDFSSEQSPRGYWVTLNILDPQGRPWKSSLALLQGGPGYFESTPVFDVAGRYTVVLDPSEDTSGSITFVPNLVSDVTTTTKLGAQKSFTVNVPGQNRVLTFAGTQGQKVVATLDSATLTSGSEGGDATSPGVAVTLYSPDGQTSTDGSPFLETTLNQSGTWKLVLDPSQDTVGSVKVTIRKSVVTTQRLTVGQRVTTPTIAPGDVMRYRFTAVAGRRVTLDVRKETLDGPGVAGVRLLRPDGTEFWNGGIGGLQFIDTPVLDVPGTWTLEIDPSLQASGQISLIVGQPTDVIGTITPGRAARVTLKQAGQQGRYTFTGIAGRFPVIDSTAKTWKTQPDGQPAEAQFRLIAPDGSDYAPFIYPQPYPTPESTTTRALLEQYTAGSFDGSLNSGGTWTLVVDPEESATGSENLTLRLLTTPTYN